MFLTRSEYDRGVNTFSPEGRLFQVEYAIEAIKIGTTAIGIATNHGVVLAVEKRLLSPLQARRGEERREEDRREEERRESPAHACLLRRSRARSRRSTRSTRTSAAR